MTIIINIGKYKQSKSSNCAYSILTSTRPGQRRQRLTRGLLVGSGLTSRPANLLARPGEGECRRARAACLVDLEGEDGKATMIIITIAGSSTAFIESASRLGRAHELMLTTKLRAWARAGSAGATWGLSVVLGRAVGSFGLLL